MRLIDADALDVGKCSSDILPKVHCNAWNSLIEIIENAPTIDAVSVVRCRDCRYLMFSDCYGECRRGNLGMVRPDDYCSYGKRMEKNAEKE